MIMVAETQGHLMRFSATLPLEIFSKPSNQKVKVKFLGYIYTLLNRKDCRTSGLENIFLIFLWVSQLQFEKAKLVFYSSNLREYVVSWKINESN